MIPRSLATACHRAVRSGVTLASHRPGSPGCHIRDDTPITDDDVRTALSANADAATLAAAIDTVLADGWTTRPGPGRLALTSDGEHRLAVVEERVHAFRELSTAGITPDEYRTAVTVLERITRNLEGH